jgi:hypothetical protein
VRRPDEASRRRSRPEPAGVRSQALRRALLLLLLAGTAAADDAIRAALDAHRFAEARALAEKGLAERPADELLLYQRAQALKGLAREAQRRDGYGAAIGLLEAHLDHPLLVKAYADCCVWGGEEERGLLGVRGAKAPLGERVAAEMKLLERLFRYEEAAALARAHGWGEAEAWARGEAALRGRLRDRAARARWLAGAGAVLLLGAWALLRRRFQPSSAPAPS